jgi:hypothetical protein
MYDIMSYKQEIPFLYVTKPSIVLNVDCKKSYRYFFP